MEVVIMARRKLTFEEYRQTDTYKKSMKTVNCFACGNEYDVNIRIDCPKEDYVCSKNCTDKLS